VNLISILDIAEILLIQTLELRHKVMFDDSNFDEAVGQLSRCNVKELILKGQNMNISKLLRLSENIDQIFHFKILNLSSDKMLFKEICVLSRILRKRNYTIIMNEKIPNLFKKIYNAFAKGNVEYKKS
jgi:hypothetical protein